MSFYEINNSKKDDWRGEENCGNRRYDEHKWVRSSLITNNRGIVDTCALLLYILACKNKPLYKHVIHNEMRADTKAEPETVIQERKERS